MKRFLVIGLGRFGRAVAEGLTEARGEVIAIDGDMALVEGVRDRVAVAAQVDSVEPESLHALGAADVDVAIVAIGHDFAAEVLTVATLKELGIGEIVARATTERERRILELVGATRIVAVEAEMGSRLARSLMAEKVVEHLSLGEGVSIVYWTADERVAGRTLAESEIETRWHLKLIGVRMAESQKLELEVSGDYTVREGDVLLLAGADARLAAFTR